MQDKKKHTWPQVSAGVWGTLAPCPRHWRTSWWDKGRKSWFWLSAAASGREGLSLWTASEDTCRHIHMRGIKNRPLLICLARLCLSGGMAKKKTTKAAPSRSERETQTFVVRRERQSALSPGQAAATTLFVVAHKFFSDVIMHKQPGRRLQLDKIRDSTESRLHLTWAVT